MTSLLDMGKVGSAGGNKPNDKNSKIYKTKKLKNTRTIRTQLYNENNDVKGHNKSKNLHNELLNKDLSLVKSDDYVNSKKREIQNLMETILKNKKYGSNKRAFQNLPRHLRRRTCSHNVKRVPKRIRKRTLKEMAKSEQKVINGNTDSLKHTKSLTNKQYYKMKMAVNLLKLLTRSKFMRRSIPSKIGKFNVGSRFQLRARIKMMETILKEKKKAKIGQLQPLLNNKLGHVDLVGENCAVKDTLRLNKSFKYYKRQQGDSGHKWLPSHIYNIKRCHMVKYFGFKVALKPTLKCYRMIYRNNGLNSKCDKTLVQDTCHLGKILITKSDGLGLLSMLTSNFDESNLKFSYKGVYVDGNYYGGVNYMKWVEKDKKLFLILDSAVYVKVLEKLLTIFADEIKTGVLKVEDLTFALGSINLVGASALNSLLKCIRSYQNETQERDSFDDLLILATQLKDYESLLNKHFILGLNIKDPRLVKYPHLPQSKNKNIGSVNADFIGKWQNMSNYSINRQFIDLMDHHKRYESYNNKLTIKQLHGSFNKSVTNSDSNIPILIYKNNDSIANSFSVLLPYHWVMPLYYKLNQLPTTQLIGLNQINQISYDNGTTSLINNPLMNVTTWQHNYFSYFSALSEREHWLKKNKGRRINYDKLKVKYGEVVQSGELGDPFKNDWKFLYELLNRGNTSIKDFLEGYSWRIENWEKEFASRFTLFNSCNNNDLIYLESGKLEIKDSGKGNIKTNARVFRISKENSPVKCMDDTTEECDFFSPSVEDLIGFVSVGCYDLSKGKSTGNAFYALNGVSREATSEYFTDRFLIKNPGETVFRLVHKMKDLS